MIYVELPVLKNDRPSTLHVVVKSANQVSEYIANKLISSLLESDRISDNMKKNPNSLSSWVNSYRLKLVEGGSLKTVHGTTLISGTDFNLSCEAKDTFVI